MNQQIRFWVFAMLIGALAGSFYAFIFHNGKPLIGSAYGIVTALFLLSFERGHLFARLQKRLKRLSAPLYALSSISIYVTLIVLSNVIAGSALLALGVLDDPFWETVLPTPRILVYSLIVSAFVAFILRMRDLVGSEVFFNLLIGRYYRPVEEDRVFLFIDLVGSTSMAEKMGPMRYQEFLGAFFATLADPVRRAHGSLDDYIGDMAMITWPLKRGVQDARCLRCVRAAQRQIERDAGEWRARFGVVPRFRAALHCGPVVTAEIGVEKHKIAYVGDTVNATARLETLGKAFNEAFLVSSDLLSKIKLPPGFTVRDLGPHAVRGRDQHLTVMAVDS
ncbi:adenylate/guanylate cyclase domain-containing protein [Microvirga flavescens]|uniref:adenylate/guanylate cyclase domain-containing protein n=1 Tax=Microvirga flavescens TaxID=2249811 RepID=UPI0013003E12|nr:adenylate/guanylate cyclase domain-containing protein [Microvirga flavescens]